MFCDYSIISGILVDERKMLDFISLLHGCFSSVRNAGTVLGRSNQKY